MEERKLPNNKHAYKTAQRVKLNSDGIVVESTEPRLIGKLCKDGKYYDAPAPAPSAPAQEQKKMGDATLWLIGLALLALGAFVGHGQ